MQSAAKKAVLFKRCGKYEFWCMENGTITLSEALDIMKRCDKMGTPVHFNITFRTFSSTTKKGGKLKQVDGAIYLFPANPDAEKTINIHNLLDPVLTAKNPNHFENRTRNIQLPSGEIRKVNIDFIISINDQKVIY